MELPDKNIYEIVIRYHSYRKRRQTTDSTSSQKSHRCLCYHCESPNHGIKRCPLLKEHIATTQQVPSVTGRFSEVRMLDAPYIPPQDWKSISDKDVVDDCIIGCKTPAEVPKDIEWVKWKDFRKNVEALFLQKRLLNELFIPYFFVKFEGFQMGRL